MTIDKTDTETDTSAETPQPTFRWLPWALAGVGAVLYLFTVNHWVTLGGMTVISRVTGWDWHPGPLDWRGSFLPPLYTLLTLPVRWLPVTARPFAMNFFSLVLAVATLWELARSVKLLPQNRTRDQRLRSQNEFGVLVGNLCWIPPAFAVLLMGLQATFWENATTATGEMLDLWIFAFCFRCLMEFRVTLNDKWLAVMALVYGLGVANNWAMIAYFPFFLAGVAWIKGMEFFNASFLARTLVAGLAGLCLYLLVPWLNGLFGAPEHGYWQVLRGYLRFQKSYLVDLPFVRIPEYRAHLFMILVPSLFPLIMCCIRWPSLGGDFNPAASRMTNLILRLMHVFFLAMGAWVFFDPKFSPSELGLKLMPFLTNYYMTALVTGYLMGYVALVFGVEPGLSWYRSIGAARAVDRGVVYLAIAAVVVVPVMLFVKNYPTIAANNLDLAGRYAKLVADSLPASNTVVLSDNSLELMLLKAQLAREGKPDNNLLLETRSLASPEYLKFLFETQPRYRPYLFRTNLPSGRVPDLVLARFLGNIARSNHVYYIHPSFGYYFESFYPRPHGLVYELKLYPTNRVILPPKLTQEDIDENENFWFGQQDALFPEVTRSRRICYEAFQIGQYLSSSLDYWGVQLERAGRIAPAGTRFDQALRLNPDNIVAELNFRFNLGLAKGIAKAIEPDKSLKERLRQYGNIDAAMGPNGPFEELQSDYDIGTIYALEGNLRQAMREFQRASELDPSWIEPRIAIAKTYVQLRMPELAVEATRQVKLMETGPQLGITNRVELLRVQAFALAETGKAGEGEKLLLDAVRRENGDVNMLGLLSQFYIQTLRTNDALATIDRLLTVAPDNTWGLFNKGKMFYTSKRYAEAVDCFNKLMSSDRKAFEPLLYRAICYLQMGNLPAAKADYEELLRLAPEPLYYVYFGLGEIAYREKATEKAVEYYGRYLELAPLFIRKGQEYKDTQARYAGLKGSK
jgi:tetratricopeptide (TPR) repeat protein